MFLINNDYFMMFLITDIKKNKSIYKYYIYKKKIKVST